MLLLVREVLFAAGFFLHVSESTLTVSLTEDDYSGAQADGYINAAVLWTDGAISSSVTLRVTPMTYVQYNTRYSASLTTPMGCYPADSRDFNTTSLLVVISPSTPNIPITLKVGIIDRNESERTNCFVIVLDVLISAESISIARNTSNMYIYNSHPFTVSFENQTLTVDEDVGTIEVYLVKDNNQKVGYNFTVMLQDYTSPPPQAGVDYIVQQMAVPFPANQQRVPVVIKIIDVSISKDDATLYLSIMPTSDYVVRQPSLQVTITNNNNVTVELENATYWLTVCLSVVDPVLVRIITLNIQAWNLTDQGQGLNPFYSGTINLFPSMTMDCINVTDNDYVSTFLVTVSSLTSRVLVIPDRDIRENIVFMTTPAVSTPAVTTPAVTTPAVSTPAVTTPAVTTPAVTTPAVTTPAVTTPTTAVTTPAVTTPVVSTPAVTTPTTAVTTPAVTTPTPAVTTSAVSTPAVSTPAVSTPAVPIPAPAVTTPAVSTPAVTTPAVTTPAVTTTAVTTPAVTTPVVSTPAVTTPAVNTPTPAVTTPTSAVTTSAVSTPAVSTPAVPTPAVTTPAVTTPTTAVTTPAVTTPVVSTPAVTTPTTAVTTPAVTTPTPAVTTPTPAVTTPAVTTPTPAVTTPTPAVTTSAVSTPAVSTPAVPTPAVPTPAPAVPTPAVSTPAVPTPAVPTPAVTTPAVPTPAVTTPAVTTPELLIISTVSMSNLTATSEPAYISHSFSWWIVLIIIVACGLLCCLCFAMAACLFICLCHKAHEKAYFPASIEGHDERYNKWRYGVIDEVKLEEYTIS